MLALPHRLNALECRIMTAILPTLTIALVIGFSWQGAHNPSLSSVGYGWDVAWRRFITVLIGITIAFIASLLPPSSRQKVSIRRTYAKVIYRMGDVVCQIISFANCKAGPTKAPRIIVNNLAALRLRVNRTVQARAMARYELSMQGAWPSELCEHFPPVLPQHRLILTSGPPRCRRASTAYVSREDPDGGFTVLTLDAYTGKCSTSSDSSRW